MLLIRIFKGEEALWLTAVTCTLLIALYLAAVIFAFPTPGPFQLRLIMLGAVVTLCYSAIGVIQNAENTDYVFAKWVAITYALFLALLTMFVTYQFLGLLYGSILLFIMVGIWCKME